MAKTSKSGAVADAPPATGAALAEEDFKAQLLHRLREIKVKDFHNQHIHLIEIISRLYAVVRIMQKQRPSPEVLERLHRVLDELKGYALSHFAAEERYLQEKNFPYVEAHRESHQRFVDKLLMVEKKMHEESTIFVVDLLHMVVSWLFDHINQVDMQYSRFAMGEPVKPKAAPMPEKASPGPSPPKPGSKLQGWKGYSKNLTGLLTDVGVPRFNDQHRQLLEQLVQLQMLVERLVLHKPTQEDWNRIDKLLEFLQKYSREHFVAEEAFMVQYRYPEREAHKAEHAQFVTRLVQMRKRLLQERNVQFTVDLNFFLLDWILNHTTRTDMKYKPYAGAGAVSDRPA